MSLHATADILEDHNPYGNFFGGCKSWRMAYFNVLSWHNFLFCEQRVSRSTLQISTLNIKCKLAIQILASCYQALKEAKISTPRKEIPAIRHVYNYRYQQCTVVSVFIANSTAGSC